MGASILFEYTSNPCLPIDIKHQANTKTVGIKLANDSRLEYQTIVRLGTMNSKLFFMFMVICLFMAGQAAIVPEANPQGSEWRRRSVIMHSHRH